MVTARRARFVLVLFAVVMLTSNVAAFCPGGKGCSCNNNGDCRSHNGCRSNRCCRSNTYGGIPSNCGACGGGGVCTGCTANYWWTGSSCVSKATNGGSCDENRKCLSDTCLGSKCCNTGTDSNCNSCGGSGVCTSCKTGYYLEGIRCYPKVVPGGNCTLDVHCDSGKCRGGMCCIPTMSSRCESCAAGSGWCARCKVDWHIRGVDCVGSITATPTMSLSHSQSESLSPSNSGETWTPSLTSTESPSTTDSLSASSTRSLTHLITSSVSTDVSSTASITLTQDLTRTPSASGSVSGTATRSDTTTRTASTSASGTGATASASKTSRPTVSVSLGTTATASHVITATTTLTTTMSRSATLRFLHTGFMNETTIRADIVDEGKRQALHVAMGGAALDFSAIDRQYASSNNTTGNTSTRSFRTLRAQPETMDSPTSTPVLPTTWCGTSSSAWDWNVSLCIGCFGALGESEDFVAENVQAYLVTNATVMLHAPQEFEISFAGHPGFSTAEDNVIAFWLTRGCLLSRRAFLPLNFTMLRTPPDVSIPEVIVETTKALGETAAIVGGIGSPVLATQMSRSGMVFRLAECVPSEEELDFTQSPFGAHFGDTKFGFYVAGAALNHVAILVFALVLVLMAFASRIVEKTSFLQGCEFARFPSLLAFAAMLLIEPTAMCCVVVMLYGSSGVVAMAGVSMTSLLAMAVGLFLYLRRHRSEFVYHPNWDEIPRGPILYFFFGNGKWTDRDGPATSGFCQRNRLFFCDYTGEHWWFLAAEMVMAIVCGAIDGFKLGVGQCDGVVIAFVTVLAIYVVILLWRRPYNAPFLHSFAITLAVLQLFGATCVMLQVVFGVAYAQLAGEWISLGTMWLLTLRMFFDIGPKAYRWYKSLIRFVLKTSRRTKEIVLEHTRGKFTKFQDLRERVLGAMDADSEVELDEVLRTKENVNRGDDDIERALLSDLDKMLDDDDDDDMMYFEAPDCVGSPDPHTLHVTEAVSISMDSIEMGDVAGEVDDEIMKPPCATAEPEYGGGCAGDADFLFDESAPAVVLIDPDKEALHSSKNAYGVNLKDQDEPPPPNTKMLVSTIFLHAQMQGKQAASEELNRLKELLERYGAQKDAFEQAVSDDKNADALLTALRAVKCIESNVLVGHVLRLREKKLLAAEAALKAALQAEYEATRATAISEALESIIDGAVTTAMENEQRCPSVSLPSVASTSDLRLLLPTGAAVGDGARSTRDTTPLLPPVTPLSEGRGRTSRCGRCSTSVEQLQLPPPPFMAGSTSRPPSPGVALTNVSFNRPPISDDGEGATKVVDEPLPEVSFGTESNDASPQQRIASSDVDAL